MSRTPYGDSVQIEIAEALGALAPAIEQTRDLLFDLNNTLYLDDPHILREALWSNLTAMMSTQRHIERAETCRKKLSPRRLAALERERKKRNE